MRQSTVALIVIAVAAVAAVVVVRVSGGNMDTATDTTLSPSTTPANTEPTTTVADTTTTTTLAGLTIPVGETVCDQYGVWAPTGTVAAEGLVEASGLAASRTTDDVFWSHNDSRDGPRAYAFRADGSVLGVFEVADAFAFDWEDMAAGPDAEGSGAFLYFGDIGDNFDIRGGVISVYRVGDVDPSQLSDRFPDATRLIYQYPEGNHNAEALFVDPIEPALYVVTKSSELTLVFRGSLVAAADAVILEQIAAIPLGAEVSGADISADGSVIVFRGYRTVWMWHRESGESVADALTRTACEAPSPEERQGEAITITGDYSYWTISEGTSPALHTVPFVTGTTEP